MSRRLPSIAMLIMSALLLSCASSSDTRSITPTPKYDADLARELGADEYGMRSYVFVVLKTGPTQITDKTRRDELFAGHFTNMADLAKRKLLVLSGPFIEGGDKRGLFIFNVASIEEARKLVQTDPAVAAGIFDAEYTRYYGSAALMMINDVHATIQQSSVQ